MTGNGNDVALSEVVGFVLLLALLIAALSLWMVYVVPINGREDEIAQMDIVRERFTDYKLSLDGIWNSISANNLSAVMTSTSINLGTGGGNTQVGGIFLSLLKPVASSGTLALKDNGDTFNIDSSSYHAVSAALVDFPLNMTTLEYTSNNYYWIQQRYVYQLGGVFLYQDDGATNRVSPLISIVKSANNSVVINIVPVKLVGGGSIGGNGPVRVDTRQRIRPNYNISQNYYLRNTWVNLSIDTADNSTASAWRTVFSDIVTREQLDSSAYTLASVWNPASKRTTVYINVTGSNPSKTWRAVSLYVRPAEFYVAFNNIASGAV